VTAVASPVLTVTGTTSNEDEDTSGSLSAAVVTQVTTSAGPNLAKTGADQASILLTFATLMLLAGAAVTLLGRRNAAQSI
jgi:LPXTG-motif cell wall-anchored protein